MTFKDTVPADTKAVLDILFVGELNDQMAGFYRSSYKDADGNTQYLATTQFESTDARRAFPCWDEPALKATFDVSLIVPTELVALSNMNVISEEPFDGANSLQGKTESIATSLKQVKYATTPLMSTYLVAFCVGPFEYIEAFTSGEYNGRPIRSRVYTLPGSAEQGRHALNVCTLALEYFAKVFGEPYPLPKVDMIAIPDFEAGKLFLLFSEMKKKINCKKKNRCHGELGFDYIQNCCIIV